MTQNEIRALASLPPVPDGDIIPTITQTPTI
jgi:hypothetical protein